jgi:hypothetical protein
VEATIYFTAVAGDKYAALIDGGMGKPGNRDTFCPDQSSADTPAMLLCLIVTLVYNFANSPLNEV